MGKVIVNFGRPMLGKLQTLEAKLDIYEDLSKEMLDKLERAVTSIQENTNKTAIILERHENRLDEGDKANQAIMSLISRVEHNLEDLEKKVDGLEKTVWMVSCSAAAIITLLQVLPNIGFSLTPTLKTSMMTPGIALVNGSN